MAIGFDVLSEERLGVIGAGQIHASAAGTVLGLRRRRRRLTGILTSDVEVVRRAYAALAADDMHELEQCFAHDAVWHEPGSNIHSGVLVGWPEIRDDFLQLQGPLSHGTLRTELVDIAVAEEYVVAVHRLTGEHNGLTLYSTSYDIVAVARGRIQEVWATHSKQPEVDAFWA